MSPDPAWVAEEERLWRALMHARYRVSDTRKNAAIVRKARLLGVKPPDDLVTEQQAVASSWKAWKSWIEH